MEILSTTALSPNGNLYSKTKKAQVIGAALAGGYMLADSINLVKSDVFQQANKVGKTQAVLFATGITLLAAGLGKIIGSIFDDKENKFRANQTDIFFKKLEEQQADKANEAFAIDEDEEIPQE